MVKEEMRMKTNIRQIRKARGLTQKQLADMIDVSESIISQYENERKSPSNETLLKLGEALDCSVSDILDDRKAFDFALSTLERDLIQKYRALDERGRKVVDAVIDAQSAIDLNEYRMVARSGHKLTPDQMDDARRVIEAMDE